MRDKEQTHLSMIVGGRDVKRSTQLEGTYKLGHAVTLAENLQADGNYAESRNVTTFAIKRAKTDSTVLPNYLREVKKRFAVTETRTTRNPDHPKVG